MIELPVEIKKEDNSQPYIVILESEYDPERHILPLVIRPLKAGEIVGLQPTGGGDRPLGESATPLSGEPDLWILHRVGVARQDYSEIGGAIVYATTDESETGRSDLIYVTLKPGLYMTGQDHREALEKQIIQKIAQAITDLSLPLLYYT